MSRACARLSLATAAAAVFPVASIGVENDHRAGAQILRDLEIILHGRQRLRVAVEPHMPDAGGGDEVQQPVQQPVPGPQDGDQGGFLAGQERRAGLRQRRLDIAHPGCEAAGDLIAEQQRDLAQQLPEPGGVGVPAAHEGELVPHQRMIDDRDRGPCGEILVRVGSG